MWHEPGPVEVAAGVHRIPLPLTGDALKAVNVYLVEDDDGFTLVDAGWDGPASRAALDEALSRLAVDVRHVRRVLVTHVHLDHVGQADALRRDTGARVWLGEDERRTFESMTSDPEGRQEERELILLEAGAHELAEEMDAAGVRASVHVGWGPPDVWAVDGAVAGRARRLRAIATPGHTAGHLCFHDEEERILLSGDHVLPHITPSIGFQAYHSPTALAEFLQSLAHVRNLDADLVLPAHGEVFTDLAGRVDALIDHHAHRLDVCAAALSPDGGTTAYGVARQLGWTRRERAFAELDLFNRWLAVWETLAHLELLESRGAVIRTVHDGTWRFTPSRAGEGKA